MRFVSFDTETTGIQVPRLVELGAVLVETNVDNHATLTIERAVVSLIVRPDGYDIPEEATRIHGISTATALACGVPLVIAISALTNLWSTAEVRVAHNIEFDDKVINGAIASLDRASALRRPRGVCTKDMAAPVLNLPPTERMIAAGFGDRAKAPSLAEAYRFFFDEDVPGAHSALADARACARVYMELLRRGKS